MWVKDWCGRLCVKQPSKILTCTDAVNAGLLKLILTVFTVTVMPSIILFTKLYFPCGAVNVCQPPPAAPAAPLASVRPNSHVSIVIFTSSKLCRQWKERNMWAIESSLDHKLANSQNAHTNAIGTLFNLVQVIRNDTWLHQADVSRIQDGSSSNSVSTFSSNCKFDKSPSPRNVLTFILSGERFFV